jgi:hypothetical protein
MTALLFALGTWLSLQIPPTPVERGGDGRFAGLLAKKQPATIWRQMDRHRVRNHVCVVKR